MTARDLPDFHTSPNGDQMDPFLHFLSLQMARPIVDSPELARRRETLREHDRVVREQRAQRRRERLRQAVALLTPRRRGYDRGFAGRSG